MAQQNKPVRDLKRILIKFRKFLDSRDMKTKDFLQILKKGIQELQLELAKLRTACPQDSQACRLITKFLTNLKSIKIDETVQRKLASTPHFDKGNVRTGR